MRVKELVELFRVSLVRGGFDFSLYYSGAIDIPEYRVYQRTGWHSLQALSFLLCHLWCVIFVTLVVLSVDVYRDASSPLKGIMSRRTPFFVLLVVWLYAAICSGPVMYSAQSVFYTEIPEVSSNVTEDLRNCSVPKLCDYLRNWGAQLSSTLFFVMALLAPLIVIVTLFFITYAYLHRDKSNGTISDKTAGVKRKVTRMLGVLSLGVVLCWGPSVLIFMLRSYNVMNDAPLGCCPDSDDCLGDDEVLELDIQSLDFCLLYTQL